MQSNKINIPLKAIFIHNSNGVGGEIAWEFEMSSAPFQVRDINSWMQYWKWHEWIKGTESGGSEKKWKQDWEGKRIRKKTLVM